MDNTLQKRAKRISLVLTLAAVLFTVVDNYLYLCHGINITPVATPVIIILVVSIVLCGVLQRYIYRWLIKYSLSPSANRQKLKADKTERTRAAVTEQAENRAEIIETKPVKEATRVEAGITAGPHRDPYMERYNQLLEEMKQQEARRHAELMEAIREYVTVATAPFLSQKALDTLLTNIEQMACGRTDSCLPLRSNPDRPLRSPELRHLAWNIGERLHISLEERARFIKLSFPHELNNATVEYLQRNLRVAVPSHIPIDIPDEDDFRFHLELIGGYRGKYPALMKS